jgi:stalled ribosome alternative rescue factor ArfA
MKHCSGSYQRRQQYETLLWFIPSYQRRQQYETLLWFISEKTTI